MAEVADVIAPVWPLKDYVAVNPYAGISHRPFMDARAFLKVFSDCETLMPIEHYAAEFHQGHFTLADIESAIDELAASGVSQVLSAAQIAENLLAIGPAGTTLDQPAATPNHDRPIRTIAEYATTPSSIDWTEAIVEEVSKHCSAHYDEGQSTWASPYRNLSLYQAWRSVAEHDRNIEILGLSGFRKYVAESASYAGGRHRSFASTFSASHNRSGLRSCYAKRSRSPVGVRGPSTKRVGPTVLALRIMI